MSRINNLQLDYYNGVRGWLLFLCLILTVFSPLMSIYNISSSYIELSQYFDFFPRLDLVFYIESSITALIIILSIRAGIALWMIKPSAVRIAKNYFLIYLGASFLTLFIPLIAELPEKVYDAMKPEVIKDFIKSLIFVATWLSYLHVSKRVRATYIQEIFTSNKRVKSQKFRTKHLLNENQKSRIKHLLNEIFPPRDSMSENYSDESIRIEESESDRLENNARKKIISKLGFHGSHKKDETEDAFTTHFYVEFNFGLGNKIQLKGMITSDTEISKDEVTNIIATTDLNKLNQKYMEKASGIVILGLFFDYDYEYMGEKVVVTYSPIEESDFRVFGDVFRDRVYTKQN